MPCIDRQASADWNRERLDLATRVACTISQVLTPEHIASLPLECQIWLQKHREDDARANQVKATPLDALANQIKLLNDRERLLLIDWIADGFDDPDLTDGLFDAVAPCFAKAEEVMPDNAVLDYPSHARRAEPWQAFRAARDERLNLRLGWSK